MVAHPAEPAVPGRSAIGWRRAAGIGAGDLGFNLYWQTAGLYLLYFYTDVLGLPARTAGLIYMGALIWDAVLDPLVGITVDRTATRFGRYRPYLLFGGLPLALAFVAMFATPRYSNDGAIVVATLAHVLFRTFYAIVSVPYSALSARVTRDSKARTDLSVARMIFATAGAIAVALLALPVAQALAPKLGVRGGWLVAAVAFGIVAIGMFQIAAFSARGLDGAGNDLPVPPLRDKFTALRSNQALWVVLGAIMVSSFCSTFLQKSIVYYFKYTEGDPRLGSLALGLMALIAAISIPGWGLVAGRFGKRTTWIAGLAPSAAGLVIWYASPATLLSLQFAGLALIATGTGAGVLCFWAMVPDTVEYAQWRTGIRAESFVFGLVSFGQKAALGLGAGGLGIALARIGYHAGSAQSAATMGALKLMMFIAPLAGVFATAALLAFYPITLERHRSMTAELQDLPEHPSF